MPWLPISEAIRARLEGNSPEYVAPYPDLDNLNKIINERNGSTEASVAVENTAVAWVVAGNLKVPIYDYDLSGAPTEHAYPSISFTLVDIEPRYTDYIYPHVKWGDSKSAGDEYQRVVAGSEEVVTDTRKFKGQEGPNKNLGKSPRLIQRKRIEEPFNFTYDIRIHSRDELLASFLVAHVLKCFPTRHFIRVAQKDGSYVDWDMFFVSHSRLDARRGVIENSGIMREYTRSIRYFVEGYLDNSDEWVFTNRIRERVVT